MSVAEGEMWKGAVCRKGVRQLQKLGVMKPVKYGAGRAQAGFEHHLLQVIVLPFALTAYMRPVTPTSSGPVIELMQFLDLSR